MREGTSRVKTRTPGRGTPIKGRYRGSAMPKYEVLGNTAKLVNLYENDADIDVKDDSE